MVINYQDGTIKFLSQSMVNGTTPRRINNSFDNVDTLIRNSNGNYWAATGANIQVAIDDVNGSTVGGGTVWLPKENYTITDTIVIPYNVTLNCNWATIIPDGDYDVVRMHPHSSIVEAIIDISSVAGYSDSNACIKFYTPDWESVWAEGFDYPRNRLVRDVSLVSAGQNGIGILLYPRDRGVGQCDDFAWNQVTNVKGRGLNCTLKLVVDDADNYVNFNLFENIYGVLCNYHIWLRCTASEISGNMFNHIKYEAETGGNEHYPIYLVGKCNNNIFSDYQVMDWIASGDTTEEIYLERFGIIEPGGCMFSGTSITHSKIYDASIVSGFSTNNTYYGKNEFRIRNLTVSNTKATGHGINPGLNSDNGICFYKDTLENPWTYIFGDVTGNDKYGAFRIDSAGNWDFITEAGDMQFAPSTGVVEITGQLEIDGIEFDSDYMELDTLIRNSNGKYWAATGANIQLAIDDQVEKGVITIPPGTYLFDDNTVWINGTHITLKGSGGKYWASSGATIFQLGANLPNGMVNVSNDGCIIEGIKFYNPGRTYTADAIVFNDAHSPKISSCGFNSIKGRCILFNDTVYAPIISECDFQSCGNTDDATVCLGTDITCTVIENCIFEVDYNCSIGVRTDETNSPGSIKVTNTFFEGVSGGNPPYAFINGTFGYIYIAGNYFIHSNGKGIDVYPSDYGRIIGNHFRYIYEGAIRARYNTVVSSNSFYNVTGDCISLSQYGVVSNNILSKIGGKGIIIGDNGTVSGNVIREAEDDGIYATGADSTVITGNTISNTEDGVTLSGDCKNCVVSGNTIDHSDNRGLFLKMQHGIVTGNTIDLAGTDAIYLLGWSGGSKAENTTISNNVIRNPGDRGITLQYANNNTIRDNTIIDDRDATVMDDGIEEQNVCIGNSFSGNSVNKAVSNKYLLSGTNHKIIKDNIGYTTESSGECHIDSGSDSVVVDHNMSLAPTSPVQITPACNLTASAITCFWTDTYTATQFTLHVNKDAVATVYFGWDSKAT